MPSRKKSTRRRFRKSSRDRRPQATRQNTLAFEALEPRKMLATIQVIAAGTTNAEQIQLQIDGNAARTWNNLGGDARNGEFVTLQHSTNQSVSADQIRVAFTNDFYDPNSGIDRNVRIDAIVIDGTRYDTEAPSVTSTGTWTPDFGVTEGNWESEYLHTNGYFQYSSNPNNGSVIEINARGQVGSETFELHIDGSAVASFSATNTSQNYSYIATRNVTADQIRVVFTNDEYIPNESDRNLIVDNIVIDAQVYETEAENVYSTGTWLPADGVTPGFRQSEILHTNGYFQYGQATQPGRIGLTLDALTINEEVGELTFIVFRSGGSDGEVSVNYTTATGSANVTQDYQGRSGTLTFADGITSQQVTIRIEEDSQVEPDETFSFFLSSPTGGATIGPITRQVVTIADNDTIEAGIVFEDSFEGGDTWSTDPNGTDSATTGQWAVGSPQATSSGATQLQLDSGNSGTRALVTGLASGSSAGSFDIDNGETSVWSPTISLPNANEIELSFAYYLSYLSSATNVDFFSAAIVSSSGVTEIFDDHAHSTNQSAQWSLIRRDISQFAGQDIRILFTAADMPGGSIVEAAVDDVKIEVLPNLPGTISVSSTGVNLNESAGTATVTLARTNGRIGTVSVNYATISGTANSTDYTPVSGTVTFADGQSEATITIPIIDDAIEESLETFTIQISNPTGGAILGSEVTGSVTIVDDDNQSGDYLPDLTPIASTLTERLSLDTDEIPGRLLLRFSTEVANAGDGPLEIWGGSTSGTSQQVFQRIYQDDGGSRDRLAGEFVYHAGHGHIHFEGFATYDLKLTDGSGNIIASGGKTSFCLINIRQPFPDVTADAGLVHGRGGSSCGQVQGISAGYSDVYSASLDDQWIDITGVADGTYWLEIETDPDNNIQETDETNNTARVQITLTNGVPTVASVPAPEAPVVAGETFTANGAGILVAVIDSGIDWTHERLSGSIWTNPGEIAGDGIDNDGNGYIDDVHGYDFFDNDSSPMDENGHGTFTAGVIAANANGASPAGLAYEAELMSVRVVGADGVGNFTAIADGIRYAVDQGADVISLAIESGYDSELLAALEYARENDVLIVAAAGNQASFAPAFVAAQSSRFGNVLSASALADDGQPLPENNRLGGSNAIQLDAPGILFSTVPGNEYATYRGSSVATAYLVGAAALALSENTELSSSQLREVLLSSADKTATDSDSAGKVNVQAAIDLAAKSSQISITQDGTHSRVRTSASDDTIRYRAGDANLQINGVTFNLGAGTESVELIGWGGNDRLFLTGTAGTDQATLRDNLATVDSGSFFTTGRQFEYVNIAAGSGSDSLRIIDSTQDDFLSFSPTGAFLSANGISRGGTGFENVRVFSMNGNDSAQLLGTEFTDRVYATSSFTRLVSPGTFIQINRFEKSDVELGGGHDSVILRGGVSDESLILTPDSANFSNSNFVTWISNLERTTSNAGGGNDLLHVFDRPERDVLNSYPRNSLLVGIGYDHRAIGFENSTFESSGGLDRATLVGTAGNETLLGTPEKADFVSSNFSTTLRNFPTLLVKGQGGFDQANLRGSNNNDSIHWSTALANIHNDDFGITAVGFERTQLDGRGGVDQLSLVDGRGDDRLKLMGDEAQLASDDYFASFAGMEDLRARSLIDDGDDVIEQLNEELEYSFASFGDWRIS